MPVPSLTEDRHKLSSISATDMDSRAPFFNFTVISLKQFHPQTRNPMDIPAVLLRIHNSNLKANMKTIHDVTEITKSPKRNLMVPIISIVTELYLYGTVKKIQFEKEDEATAKNESL
ncbi:hypothetical protein V6N13_125246 [Hibiscus sabdariffa]|uniref:Uncharacterized protein n=1 Tax=Hibiscus sabdariffa TaxID=183260 RepID=A0ABR2U596_9ROSI